MEISTPMPLPVQRIRQIAHEKSIELGCEDLFRCESWANPHLWSDREHFDLKTRNPHSYL
ncbi:hypothetical protein [Effusibacillus consociatus]|uniref:Uncharacterized protein n=1 Tax=Effusibacillus consociatus TaxID=1117041 RepID=A0ABV9Q5D2_9BACL